MSQKDLLREILEELRAIRGLLEQRQYSYPYPWPYYVYPQPYTITWGDTGSIDCHQNQPGTWTRWTGERDALT